ncbi:MAG: SDR family oxidoreductase [Gammaproteobacteria bacterium]
MSENLRPEKYQHLQSVSVLNNPNYQYSGKFKNKVAFIPDADSGIGRTLAILFAKEGADVVCSHLNEDLDAEVTRQFVEKLGRRCLLINGDIRQSKHCNKLVDLTIKVFGRLDILVNHDDEHTSTEILQEISNIKLNHILKVNVFTECHIRRASSHVDHYIDYYQCQNLKSI